MRQSFITAFTTSCVLACALLFSANAQSLSDRLDSLFMAPGNYEHINGNVLIAQDKDIIYQRSFGYANERTGLLNDSNARFNIASITKTFTATCILQLVEKRKISLDSPLAKYIPEFPFKNISIRNLLSHTSGLPDYEIFFDIIKHDSAKVLASSDIMPALIKFNKPLKFQPGDEWNYCNTNFELLALLVEKVSKKKFAEYVRQHILIPAGMLHTSIKDISIRSAADHEVTAYMRPKLYLSANVPADSVNNPFIKQVLINFSGLPGAGMIVSTTGDLLRYDHALYSGGLLSRKMLDEAFKPTQLNHGKEYDASLNKRLKKSHYGLGWEIYADTSAGKIVSHGGSYPGIVSVFMRNLTKKQTVIIFDNTGWTGIFFLSQMASGILNNQPVNDIPGKKSLASVYGTMLMEHGSDDATNRLIQLRNDTVHYRLNEKDLNTLGYQFLQDGYLDKAEETFRMNTLLWPQSFNVYDSYADALARNGKTIDAIVFYKTSLKLNPEYQEAKDKLNKLISLNPAQLLKE